MLRQRVKARLVFFDSGDGGGDNLPCLRLCQRQHRANAVYLVAENFNFFHAAAAGHGRAPTMHKLSGKSPAAWRTNQRKSPS